MPSFSFTAEAMQRSRLPGLFGPRFKGRRPYDVLHDNGTGTICFIRNGDEPRVVARATAETLVARDGLEITLGGHTQLYHRYTGLFRSDNEEDAERLHQFLLHAIAQLGRPQVDPVGDALPSIEGEPAQGLPVGALQEENVPSVGDALPPIEGEPAQGLPVGALQEEIVPSVGDALPPIEGEPAQGLPVGALQEEIVPPVLIPVEVPPPPPGPGRLAELPGFVDECRTGHMSPTEAKRMFCTLFAAFIVRATGNHNHQDRYNEMINGSVVDTDKLTQIGTKCIIQPGPAALAVMTHF